ncbi:MAG: DNA ligase D [Chitinophagales bacterium]
MGLSKYKQKRAFDITPEPQGGKAEAGKLRFVIQKHAASHLHYDFRLEMEGVLKSWAVPKGPSTDPEVKRLAMMVEDHPYDYRTFEGIIPQGQYGGGTVIVWDEGTYEAVGVEGKNKKDHEKALLSELAKGRLKFELKGKKLKGIYNLVKTANRGENAWLLFKHDDKYTSKSDITKKEKSVVSGKTLEQIAKTSTNIYGSHKKATPKKKKAAAVKKKRAAPKKEKAEAAINDVLQQAAKKPFPENLKPCLATLVDKPFDEPGWFYEIKWDGYRALAFKNKKTLELKSRNDKSFNEKFYAIYDEIKKWDIDVVLDGEIVSLNDEGLPNFGGIQNWRSEADGPLVYYVFDILWYEGRSLQELTLAERKEILADVLPVSDTIRLSEAVETSGLDFYEAARKLGLEGIIAKRKDSIYRPGDRTTDWLKIKSNKRQEMVIGGFTKNNDTVKVFSSLLLGVYQDGRLHYTGKVGTGFNDKMQKKMMQQFKPLVTTKCPFTEPPDVNKPSRFRPNPPQASVTWLKPQLVCEVSYAEMTSDGIMRHPSFEGMREDKKAKDVKMETEVKTEKAVKKKAAKHKLIKPAKNSRKTLLNPQDEMQTRVLNGHELKFNNLSKVFWEDVNVTKRDMLNYYYQIAPYMLPHLIDRPQSMNRFPNGVKGKSFYQKDVTGKFPDWAETYLYHSDADNRDRNYFVCTNEAGLLYMASLACIEMNPWSSRVQSPDNPDWCVIDLDPDKNSFEQVIEAAQTTKAVLDEMKVPSYCKTSGSTGLHIYIPLAAKYTYEESKEFARLIVTLVHERLPKYTTIERMVSNRKGKMYLDFLQNRAQATIAAPYSLRPKPGAMVSMPLHWDEVKKGLKMSDFNIFNAVDRVKSEGDLFKPVLGKGINMQKILKDFNSRR